MPLFYRGADNSLARSTSRYILFDGENISFDASLVIYRISGPIRRNAIFRLEILEKIMMNVF